MLYAGLWSVWSLLHCFRLIPVDHVGPLPTFGGDVYDFAENVVNTYAAALGDAVRHGVPGAGELRQGFKYEDIHAVITKARTASELVTRLLSEETRLGAEIDTVTNVISERECV